MSDPRLVTPQRVDAPDVQRAVDDGCGDHVYWCWKRTTGAVVLGALVLAFAATTIWWWAR
jgi:hypothetical protein